MSSISRGVIQPKHLFTLFERNLAPSDARQAKQRFAECLVFSWIVGHNDGHTKNYSLTHAPESSFLSPFCDLNSALPFELSEAVRATDYHAYDGVQLAIAGDGAATIGDFGLESLRVLERHAGLPVRHLEDFALYVAAKLQATLSEVISTLPEALQQLPVVQLYPFATYAQTLRVRDVLSDTSE